MKKIYPVLFGLAVLSIVPALAASTKKQSAIQSGTTVRNKVEAKGIYSQECYDAYYGCMDQFCITENSNGGSCACSDKSAKYESQLSDILKILDEANRIENEEVERINLGAKADIVFGGGKREYDANGNVVYDKADKKAGKRAAVLAMLEQKNTDFDDEDVLTETGDALFAAADELCREQIEEDCDKDFKFLKQIYARQIESDCKAFENSVAQQKKDADAKMASAESAVRKALDESFKSANKYNQGECQVELKKCMQGPDACGADWDNCVSIAAAENIAKNPELGSLKDIDITGTGLYSSKSKTIGKVGGTFSASAMFKISPIVLRILEAKRPICERVLDSCMSVRDIVWEAFLNEAAPDLKIAESKAESKQRQSCLKIIPQCIQTACKDDIVGKGKETMDACLSRPEMVRSFCKPEIEACERVDKNIWAYVKDQLLAMRVDACTQELKDCITNENRCGANFENCIGVDYKFISKMCPLNDLVICKKMNKTEDELAQMLSGLYLNIDNIAMDNCLNLVRQKMVDVCGSEHDCNRFAADGNIGAGSLSFQKNGNVYEISGMISFGSIKMGDASGHFGTRLGRETDNTKELEPGEIGVQDYIENVKDNNTGNDGVIARIEAELNNIAGNINRTIELISQDPRIQQCINGRDLSQITGKEKDKTEARFPYLLDNVKIEIAMAALTKARENYEAKYNEYVSKATRDLDVDIAQYMCQNMSAGENETKSTGINTSVAKPYAISYQIGAGLSAADLMRGGHSTTSLGETKIERTKKKSMTTSNGTREVWSVFNRETRMCRFCTSTIVNNCDTVYKGWGGKAEANCVQSEPVEKCEDIQM